MHRKKLAMRTAKSLPSLRQEALCQSTPDLPELPALPSPFPVLNTIILDSYGSGPAWDREVDVTFLKNPLKKDSNHSEVRKASDDVLGYVSADDLSTAAKNKPASLKGLTYGAVLSALNYAEKRRRSRDRLDGQFERAVHMLSRTNGGLVSGNEWSAIKLPANIRRRIWGFVLCDEPDEKPKPVRLQPFNPFFKEVWQPGDFQSVRELFSAGQGALAASHSLRTELVAYVLTTHRFHFVFSPFARQNVCQQMFHWIEQYSDLMEYMTVELDLSKLCFSATQEASDLIWTNLNIVHGLKTWVNVQANIRTVPLESLLLLAHAEFSVVERIVKLSGRINTLRIAGFNAVTTNTLITALFPYTDFSDAQGLQHHCSRAGTSTIWPFIPGQPSIHQDGRIPRAAPPMLEVTSAGKLSMARKQIAKFKDMVEAYEAKRQRHREASIELDNERQIATKQSNKSWVSLRGTVRRGGKSDGVEPKISGEGVKVSTRASPSPLTANTPIHDDINESKICIIIKPSVQGEELNQKNEVTPKASQRIVTSNELGNQCRVRDGSNNNNNESAHEPQRASQASSRSLQSKRSIRWSEDIPPHKGYSSTDITTAPQVMREIKSLPVGGSALEAVQVASPALRKKGSARELSRKKSFADMFRRASQAETAREVKTPRRPEPPKALRNFSAVDLSNNHRRAPM